MTASNESNTLLFQKLRQRPQVFPCISTRSRKRFWQCHDISLTQLDCSQPSIFSYFYSIVERADRIARELDAKTKGRLDRVRGGTSTREHFQHQAFSALLNARYHKIAVCNIFFSRLHGFFDVCFLIVTRERTINMSSSERERTRSFSFVSYLLFRCLVL